MSKSDKDIEDGIMRRIVGGWILMSLGGIMIIAAIWTREWEHFFSGIAVAIIGKFFCNGGWDDLGELKDINFKELFNVERSKLPKEEAVHQLKLILRGGSVVIALSGLALVTYGYTFDPGINRWILIIHGIIFFILSIPLWRVSSRIK